MRKQLSTVTKNKESLNAKLDTIPLPDPLFSKLNSIMGDVSSSNRLLLNILQTDTSSLKLTLDDKFWDGSKREEPEVKEEFNEDDISELPCLDINSRQKLRQQLSGYMVTNTPIDDDDEDIPQVTNGSFNQSQIEYAFDINAEVEPEPDGDHYAIDYDMEGDGGVMEYDEDDRTAINACKGLRRATTIIEELRPSDTMKLEYSYRPMENINQFWAGPSYWKFRKSRKLTMGTNTTAGTVVVANGTVAKRKQTKNKVQPIFSEISENSGSGGEDFTKFVDENVFISDKSKAGQKWKKTNLYKRWDSKKLKLPTDLRIDRDLFDNYKFAPGIRVQMNDPSVTPQIQSDGYNYDNAEDPEYGSPAVSTFVLIANLRAFKKKEYF